MAIYPSLVRRIISLLLLIIQDRVGSTSLGGDIIADTTLALNGSPYVASQDLVVAENATLTIQPGVQLHFDVGVGLQVKGSLQAKGNLRQRIAFTKTPTNGSVNVDDLNISAPYSDGIRLSDGDSYRVGRLEIFLNGQWGTVCDDSWDMRDTEVACRQLGFLEAKSYYTHGNGTGPNWLDNVNCQGTEISLLECKHIGIGVHNCGHSKDIGIECLGLTKLKSWKGIEFSSLKKPLSLQYVDVSLAYEAIKGVEFLPDLVHVTVKRSVYGVTSANVSSPLAIRDSSIRDNLFAGIQIKGISKNITIENTAVDNTTHGHGFNYSGIAPAPVDFCSANMDNINSLPIILQALGKARTTVDCTKIIKTQPGHLLAVHYQSMSGERFELEVHDGNTTNATQLTLVNQWTGANQAVTPSLSSGHELYIRFRYNADSRDARVKFLITDDQDAASLVISNCTFRDNHKKGVSLKNFTGNMIIDKTTVARNNEGITAERILGTLTATNSHFINNSANGLEILNSSLHSCNLHELSAKGNAENGLNFQRVYCKGRVSQSEFVGNHKNGFAIANGAGEVNFLNTTAVLNTNSGVRIYDGQVASRFKDCNFSSNMEDGCFISNQEGAHQFFNCTATSNLRHGVSLFDPQSSSPSLKYYFKQISLINNTINDNFQYGFRLAPEAHSYYSNLAVNITLVISKNQFMRNRRGAIFLSPDHFWWPKPRGLKAIVTNNHFELNKGNAFYINCTRAFGLKAVIESNNFTNNTDQVLTMVDDNKCGTIDKRSSVDVSIDKNTFMKNRAENVLFIDFSFFPEKSSVVVRNNTFEDNEVVTKDLFPNFFRASTTRAVIVLKEGSFTLHENIFKNPSFQFQISTLRQNSGRAIDAKFNWWGTTKECEIVDRIFDFHHRVHLSPVDFFPYLLSSNKTRANNASIPRPSCFLRGASIGGIVDRPLSLSSADSPYKVRDDIIILTNGSLVIPKNVTLEFPSRSAMVVQGKLIVDGTENEKVRFTKMQRQKGFRLGGGDGPWAGRVEFLVNNTWWPLCLPYKESFTREAKVICQQLDLFYKNYTVLPHPREENGFVRNVVCDGNDDGDIMNCSANAWSYGPTCWGNTVHVYCQQFNWAGLHLTMSNHKSSLHHLEIHDAGYAYNLQICDYQYGHIYCRDNYIPGAALKVDFNHHNISNIFVNNSVGIGVQVVYQSLFYDQSLMPHSTVSNTKYFGVLSRSPSLTLTDVNVTSSDIYGFFYESTWDGINIYTAEMASPDVNKTLHACSKNKTFLLANKLYYFTLEALERTLQLRCQHAMETEPGYKLVIQALYYTPWYGNLYYFHVYDGTNASGCSPWKMKSLSWEDRPVFNSTKSSILFDIYKHVGIELAINFLVYTVRESQQFDYTGGEIRIDRATITNSLQGNVRIGGKIKSLTITDTDIANSKEFGIKISKRDIDVVKIISTNLQKNRKGIEFPEMSTTELTIENCTINGSENYGVYIHNEGKGIINIVNSIITASGIRGLQVIDYTKRETLTLTLFISGSTFSWNKMGALLYSRDYFPKYKDFPAVQITSSHFFRNQGPTVDIRSKGHWVFVNNTFEENQGTSVIAFHKFDFDQYGDLKKWTSPFVVQDNLFTANQCKDKAVIYIGGTANRNKVVIRSNKFTSNLGRCVRLEGTATHVPTAITDNIFNKNYCKDKSVIEVLHLDENSTFSNNIFTHNRGEGIVLLRMIHDIHPKIQREKVAFNNNTLSNNIPFASLPLSTAGNYCALVLSAIHYYKETEFSFNKFDNGKYRRELCIRFPASSSRDVVNVTHNWWGTTIASEVRDRISDFDDNYDFAIANDWPFLLSRDDPTLTVVEKNDSKQHGSVLSGRLFESLVLKASRSPYSLTSDFTVLENVTLTIEAGVTVKVSPGMSILVAGALQALGTSAKPVIFTVKEPTGSNNDSHLPVRLLDGDFPWEGRAEVYYNNSWKRIFASSNVYLRNVTKVVCRQLGYGPPVAAMERSDAFGQAVSVSWPVEFLCQGNETSLHECPTLRRNLDRSSMLDVVAKCQSMSWGNLRFVSSRDLNTSQTESVLNHVEFSHCGVRHGMAVPALEAVTNVPKLKSISIRNCLSGGLHIHSPRNDVHVYNSTFFNTGGTGISFVQTRRNILVESSESSKNQQGISFEEPSAQNVPRVRYGRVFLCSEEKVIFVNNQTHLYFDIPRPKNRVASLTCQKVLTVRKGQGIKLTLLYFKGTQDLEIYDSNNTADVILKTYYSIGLMTDLVHKELFIPRDAILVQWRAWGGDVNSEIVFLVEDKNIKDMPCTYQSGFCGWQTFTNMSVNGINVTRTWETSTKGDYYYFSVQGKSLYIGNEPQSYVGGRAAIISPSITKLSQFCSIVFSYRVARKGKAGLSLYIQTGAFPTTEQRLIWRAINVYAYKWRKVVLDLPNDVDEYRLLFEGEYGDGKSYSRNFVAIDNLEFRSCSVKGEHRISNSVFSDNILQAISYTSVADGSDKRPSFTIERCKITDTATSATNVSQKSAISLDIQDNKFTLANNFISGNRFGGIQARLGQSDGTSFQKSFIYGNTFSGNANGTILVEGRTGSRSCFVSTVDNIFESNLGNGSTVKLFEVQSEIINNFIYNNSGLFTLEYDFSSDLHKEQKCELNTFYLNKGLGQNYRATVLSNGPMVYHRNNFKNPSNLYEFISTTQAVSKPIDAAQNWWGVKGDALVASRI
ncbi:protein bark beetle-like isoform X1 [Oculina patagonica]